MVNSIKRLYLLPICLITINGCGDASPHQPLINPSDAFDHLYEAPLVRSEDCERLEGYGCASVNTSGTIVRGSFKYDYLFATCTRDEQGIRIDLKNSVSTEATFQLRATIAGLSEPQRVQVCQGIVWETGPQARAKVGSCDLIVKIHGESVAASSKQSCIMQFAVGEPYRGRISCKMLDNSTKFLVIHGDSQFQCPS